jgi:hypothetical protein
MKIKLLVFSFVFMMLGCSALLPTVKRTTPSPWQSFHEAKASFDKIAPYKTTKEGLKQLGFDPFLTPNVKILTYLDIATAMTSDTKKSIDKGLEACIKAKNECHAYEFEPKIIKRKRYGNFWLDFFNFRKKIRETGWKFKAFIVVVNDTVVYKLWGGDPLIEEKTDIKNPLGPLQDSGDLLIERLL